MKANISEHRVSLLTSVIWDDGRTAYDHGFRSLAHIARVLEKNYQAVWRRINRNGIVTFDGLRGVRRRNEIVVRKQKKIKISDQLLCEVFSIKPCTYYGRRKSGRTRRQALELDLFYDARTAKGARSDCLVRLQKDRKSLELVKKSSDKVKLYEVCRKRGFTENQIRKRLRNGQTIKQALGLEPLSGILYEDAERFMSANISDFGIKVWNLWYRNLDQFARKWGLRISRVRRLKKEGLPLEDIPFCPDKNNPGLYSKERFERDPELANQPARVYLVSFTLEGQLMLKVGVTCSSVDQRLCSMKEPINIFAEFEGRLQDCFSAEQLVLEVFQDVCGLQRADDIVMEGKTETFCNPNPRRAADYVAVMRRIVQTFPLRPRRLVERICQGVTDTQ